MASESGTPPVVPDGGPSGPAPSEGAAPVRRSFFRRRVLPCLLLFVLLTLLAGAGAVWWLRTPDGQDWLRQEADALLAPPLAEQGLSLELIRLEGALPLEMECALRLRDAGGLWLDVPRARVDVGLSVFPPGISLDLRLEHPSLYRLPQLPPSPDEPSPPLAETLAGVETALRSALDITASLPGWLPSLRVREVALDGLWLGSAVLDGSPSGTLVDASGQAAQDAAASAGAGSVPADGQMSPAPAVAASAPAQEAMTPGAPPAPPLSVAVAAVESALRVGEGLEVSLCLTAEADFSLSGTTARAGLQASWQLASASAAAAPATEETPSAAAPVPGSGVTAPGMTPAAAPAQEAGPVPAQEKSTDTAPLLTEAAGRWLPEPLALLLTPGQASSLPHGVPRNVKLEKGFFTMDFGAVYQGYCSDMTRTVVLGKADAAMKKLYNTVLEAQRAGLAAARPGVGCREMDQAARDIINKAGYKGCFGHSLGHGVGKYIHENPRVAPGAPEDSVLRPGHVVTVEPGIYVEGKYGCRIEDMIVITEDGSRNFAHSPKELMELL